MESLTTNITLAELCRKYNLKPNVFYGWKHISQVVKAGGFKHFRRATQTAFNIIYEAKA
jgi:hypothetical protein